MHTNTQRHPWVSIVMRWSIASPHYMSAKLLQGSSWDDVHGTGDVSEWTVRQRHITVHLLDDSFMSEAKLDMRVVGSTIQILLGVEVSLFLHQFSLFSNFLPLPSVHTSNVSSLFSFLLETMKTSLVLRTFAIASSSAPLNLTT